MLALHVLFLAAALMQRGNGLTCYAPASQPAVPLCSSCGGGTCTVDNGCVCANDQTTVCVPTTECSSIGLNVCCPKGYYWSASDNCCTGTVICNPSCNSDEVCTNVNSVATCSCNSTYYYGLHSSSLAATVKCGSPFITVSFSRCLLETLGYDPDSYHLNDKSDACTNSYKETVGGITRQTMQVLPQTGWCGNVMTTDSSKVYYSNVLHIGVQNRTLITASPVNLTFSCSYNRTMQINLIGSLNVSSNTVNLTANGEGSVTTTMTAYWDAEYTEEIQSSDNVPIGSDIYIGILANGGDGSAFVLRTESCFATPDNDVNNVNKIAILSGGCPTNQGVTAYVESNGESFESRIQFSTFAFEGQPLVYITCTVRLCDKSTSCTGCATARDANGGTDAVQLQVNLNSELSGNSNSASSRAVSWALLTSCLLAFLSLKFF